MESPSGGGPASPAQVSSRFRSRLREALHEAHEGEAVPAVREEPVPPPGKQEPVSNGDRVFSMPQLKALYSKWRALGDGQDISRRVWEARTWSIFGMQRGKYFAAADYDRKEAMCFGKYVRLMALLADKGVLRSADLGPPDEGGGMSWRQVSAAERTFRKLDSDGNQVISCEELLGELRKANPDATTRGATRLLAVLDSDSSGEISFDEFLEGVVLGAIALDPALLPDLPPGPAPSPAPDHHAPSPALSPSPQPPVAPSPQPPVASSPQPPVAAGSHPPSPHPPSPQPRPPSEPPGGDGHRSGGGSLRGGRIPSLRVAVPGEAARDDDLSSPPPVADPPSPRRAGVRGLLAGSPSLLPRATSVQDGRSPRHAPVSPADRESAGTPPSTSPVPPRAAAARMPSPLRASGAPPSPRALYPAGLSRSDGVFRAAAVGGLPGVEARPPDGPRPFRRGSDEGAPSAAAPAARRASPVPSGLRRGSDEGRGASKQALYRLFRQLDGDDDGALGPADVEPLAPFSRLPPAAIFSALDREHAGRVTVDVWLEAACDAGVDLPAAFAALSPTKKAADAAMPIPPLLPAASAELKVKAYKAFAAFDVDGSGTISIDELAGLLRAIDGRVTAPEVHRIFLQVDVDRSGLITFDEFLAAAHTATLDLDRLDLSRLPAQPRAPSPAGRDARRALEWEIAYEELRLGRRLGEGSFGIVFEADWRGTRVAVKMLKGRPDGGGAEAHAEELRREIAVLCGQRHPNIALFMGACTRRPHLCLVTEFLDGGSVWDLVHGPQAARREGRATGLEPAHAVHIATQVARGLNYLHLSRTPIIHHDLKPDNLLLDKNMNVKLCDFGLATVRTSASPSGPGPRPNFIDDGSYTGTLNYMAPEQLSSPLPSSDVRTDIFALGSCIFEMLTGEIPFRGMEYRAVRRLVCDEGVRPTFPPAGGPRNLPFPPALVALVERCWAARPEQRPSAGDVLRVLETMAAAPHALGPDTPPRRRSRGGSRDGQLQE